MTVPAFDSPYRVAGLRASLTSTMLRLAPLVFAVLRRIRPIFRFGTQWIVTRHDDVLEVFATDAVFAAPYRDNLDVITGGVPFFLGLDDTAQYHAQIAAMRAVVLPTDLPGLGDEAEARARALVLASGGRVEVVGLVRRVIFDLMAGYFGVPEPAGGRLDIWASRLFEFQFTGSTKNVAWRSEAAQLAAAFRAHIDQVIAARRATRHGPDDVLARCLARQAANVPGYSDVDIRTALLCMIVGGPPSRRWCCPRRSTSS